MAIAIQENQVDQHTVLNRYFGELEKEDQKDEEGNPLEFCKSWVLEPSREAAKVVGEGRLDEGCVTSPAFQDGRIYIRGKRHLFCIGKK